MEKLIELLNEYDGTPIEWKQIGDKIYFDGLGGNSELHELIIISKYYGFIQWLVDNDKIDLKKLDEVERKPMYVTNDMFSLYKVDECVIMLCSIQDNPIEFLISILR